jgi:hypothetical protein
MHAQIRLAHRESGKLAKYGQFNEDKTKNLTAETAEIAEKRDLSRVRKAMHAQIRLAPREDGRSRNTANSTRPPYITFMTLYK